MRNGKASRLATASLLKSDEPKGLEGSTPSLTAKYKRPNSLISCGVCGKYFYKENREIKRSQKRGHKNCCSRNCSSKLGAPRTKGFWFYVNACRNRAKRKSLPFNLSTKYLESIFEKQKGRCAITNLNMNMNSCLKSGNEKDLFYASVDRIDNTKGYIEGNVQFVCLGFNYMRNSVTLEKAIEFIRKLKEVDELKRS